MLNRTLAALFTLSAIPITAQSLDNDFTIALGLAGLGTDTARFDPAMTKFFKSTAFETPVFSSVYEKPWMTPFVMSSFQKSIDATSSSPQESLAAASRLIGAPARRALLGSPIANTVTSSRTKGYLKALLTKLKTDNILVGDAPDLTAVPEPVQQAAGIILRTAMDAIRYRRAALSKIGNVPQAFDHVIKTEMETEDPETAVQNVELYERVQLGPLMAGGVDMAEAVTEAGNLMGTVPGSIKYKVTFRTVWGVVSLSGGSNDAYTGESNYLLIIDSGGDDVYTNVPATKSALNWLSVVLDANGKDRYVSSPDLIGTELSKWGGRKKRTTLGPGAAAFGYAYLFDLSGDDYYSSHLAGLGTAFFGMSALVDVNGSDRYVGYKNCQAAAFAGVGYLEDRGGSDSYYGFTQCQGFGGTLGAGLLIDRSGSDTYTAEDTVYDFPSPQSPTHNTSFAQGAALGRRADYLEGLSLAGGVGILFDQAGTDRYSCGVFGQGAGYWGGFGALLDATGDDQYLGQWYAQGSAAHFAVGYLHDGFGRDSYRAPLNMAMGAGHDFSVGMLVEDSGNDTYSAPNLSLGAGNANGIGVFADLAGDDFYTAQGITLGRVPEPTMGSLREKALTLGVFMDLSGEDSYPVSAAYAKNAARMTNWALRGEPEQSQVGVFFDR